MKPSEVDPELLLSALAAFEADLTDAVAEFEQASERLKAANARAERLRTLKDLLTEFLGNAKEGVTP